MPACPACRSDVPAGARFCDQCGTALSASGARSAPTKVIRIGRDPDNEVRLAATQTQVSRHHARVMVADGALYIEDLGSANGVYVNGVPAQGQTPFRLEDEVRFGSYVFDTARLRPFVRVSAAAGADVAPVSLRLGAGRVHARATFMDRALAGEETWLRTFLLAAGIGLLVLFFTPLAIRGDEVVTTFSVIGEKGVPGTMKVVMALLPVTGIVLLVLRAMGASQVSVGAVLLAASLPMVVASITAPAPALVQAVAEGSLAWRSALGILALGGTALALMIHSTRPDEPVARTLLAVCPLLLLLLFLVPVSVLGRSVVPLIGLLRNFEELPPAGVMAATGALLILASCLGGLLFLLPEGRPGQHGPPAQVLSLALCALPGTLVLFILLAEEGGKLLLTGLWMSAFLTVHFLFPVLGGTILFQSLRRA